MDSGCYNWDGNNVTPGNSTGDFRYGIIFYFSLYEKHEITL